MDVLSVELSRVEPTSIPEGLSEAFQVFQACDNALYPAVRLGDVLCCEGPISPGDDWPYLAVVRFNDGSVAAVKSMPSRNTYQWAVKVKVTLRR